MKIIQEIKNEYSRNKLRTIFMLIVGSIAILNFIKPGSTSGILRYLGLSIINFTILALIILSVWWFWWRTK